LAAKGGKGQQSGGGNLSTPDSGNHKAVGGGPLNNKHFLPSPV